MGAACVEALELGYSGNYRSQWRVDTGGKQGMKGRQGYRGRCIHGEAFRLWSKCNIKLLSSLRRDFKRISLADKW